MSEHTRTSWIEVDAATDLVPENRRTELLEVIKSADWVPVHGTHPFSQGYAVRTALTRIPNALETTYSQMWTVPQPDVRTYSVIGLRTSLQELFFLDDGDRSMQCVLIRPVSTAI
ncbi:hypothetical protein K388_06021 [Streptomyces sp. KhCrAH-43]|uniref:hypothetical protein n=1 Tax=unclassified Streptomyces TaxID=2593676 RepID=UPI00036B7A19|nr:MULTISPECIES: hypothetical protein [unclassified Streptomyces]MYS33679.1 hypothetical protein [Streptomyces sp. SID4920]MYX63728.1 hypothetical protein [Streptomyces sp. SID8373]RAJ52921.1 hypothetical protein K388_06021 [Streptomyces sp. KhCrAH-43]